MRVILHVKRKNSLMPSLREFWIQILIFLKNQVAHLGRRNIQLTELKLEGISKPYFKAKVL